MHQGCSVAVALRMAAKKTLDSPLDGLRVVVKDMFEIAGHHTGLNGRPFLGISKSGRITPFRQTQRCRRELWDPLTKAINPENVLDGFQNLTTAQIREKLLLMSTESFEHLVGQLKTDRLDILDALLSKYPEAETEKAKTNFRQILERLLTRDVVDCVIERRSGVVAEALEFDLECMDKRRPCRCGEHKREQAHPSEANEADEPDARRENVSGRNESVQD